MHKIWGWPLFLSSLLFCLPSVSAFGHQYESPSFKGTLPNTRSGSSNELNKIENSTNFPYRAVGRLDTGCTGTLIGPKHVLTAAHCVYNMDKDVYYDELEFSPGRDGDEYPFGTIEFEKVVAPKGWTKDHDSDFDYALVTLTEPIGNQVGWLGYGVADIVENLKINIVGYPGDKPAGTMWGSRCRVFGVEPSWIHYQCETVGGMSGSGVFEKSSLEDDRYTIRGIHALGGPEFNSATRITKTVYADIQRWLK